MKKIATTLVLVSIITISCQKAIDTQPQPKALELKTMSTETSPIEAKFVVNGHDTVVLQLVMSPALVCYSYRNGETPKPCNIFIEFTCTLSQPVNGYVKVDVQRTNIIGTNDPKPSGSENTAGVSFNIAPNTTRYTYRSTLQTDNNQMVAENSFRIDNVSMYRFIN
ncbi:MAG: hypothetical protein JWQ30_548 [Sediminibacterium sp.]|nr:hypothetical protein [Sediminibacterium sp.]